MSTGADSDRGGTKGKMKTISDDAKKEQERLLNATFITRVEFWRQYGQAITAFNNTAKTLTVPGDATSFISANNYIFIPLHDFNIIYLVQSISYSAGSDETTITLDTTETLETAMAGLEVARRYVVSYGDTERMIEMSPIDFRTEGDALNEFMADDVTFSFDNGDGFFSNKDSTGIFDFDDVFWVRILTGYKNASDRILFFGGIIDDESLEADRSSRTFTCSAFGHIKELERYPGDIISNPNGEFVKINGLTIKAFEAGDLIQAGIKKFEFKPFKSSRLAGVSITQVSNDIPEGLKVLEYRYPHMFRFDRGPWTEVAKTSDVNSNGEKKLYAKDGTGDLLFALCNFGSSEELNEFPTQDDEMLILVEGNLSKKISKTGKPVIKFDDGEETVLKAHLQRALVYENAGGTYTDFADDIASPNEDEVTVLAASGDSLILIASERIWGMQFLFHTVYGSDPNIEIKYSVGGESWSSAMSAGGNGLIDGTDGFTKDGDITWTSADGWRENFLIISADIEYHGFMLKIQRTGGSTSCKIDEIRRIIRCRGKDNDFLSLKLNLQNLTIDDQDVEIVIRQISNVWTACTWYQNIAIKSILKKALDEAQYYTANRDIDDLKITSISAALNIYGKPPKYNYDKLPTAVFYADDYIYIGARNELWRIAEEGEFEFLCEFFSVSQATLKYQEIVDIRKDSDSIICLIRGRYDVYERTEIEKDFCQATYNLASRAIVYNKTTATSCEYFFRSGSRFVYNSINYNRMIGQGHSSWADCGENILIPFKQFITLTRNEDPQGIYSEAYFELQPGLFDSDDNLNKLIDLGDEDDEFQFYNAPVGYYRVRAAWWHSGDGSDYTQVPYGFRYTFGQQGVMLYDTVNKEFLFFKYYAGSPGYWRLTTVNGTIIYSIYIFDMNQLPSCGVIGDSAIFLGHVRWHDMNDNVSYSYLSHFKQCAKARDWTKAYFRDNGGAIYSDQTGAFNGNSASVTFSNTDEIYLGSDKKFLSAYVVTSDPSLSLDAVVKVQYWNGSAWTDLEYLDQTYTTAVRSIAWEMPTNWMIEDFDTIQGTSIDSTDRYWVKLSVTNYSSGSLSITGLYNNWSILWDSKNDNSGSYDTLTPLWLCYNDDENTLHGVMFDRDENSAYGFEYLYFVYDLDNETMHVSQAGSNFTFNPSLTIKDFIYNSYDQKVYAIVEDVRYNEHPAYLISAVFSGGAITLTKESDIVSGEWGSACPLALRASDGTLYGVTKEKANYLWQYGKEFYPRILLADFNDMTFREILAEAAKVINQVFTVLSERKALFYERESYNGEQTLFEYAHIADVKPVKRWEHIYDGVKVEWTDPFTDASGTEKAGLFGWRRKILTISSPFIQNRFLAKVLAEKYYDYFGTVRQEMETELTALIQLEERDRLKLIVNSANFDVDRDTWWIAHHLTFDPELLMITLKGVN